MAPLPPPTDRSSTVSTTPGTRAWHLLRQAQAASRRGRDQEARAFLKAALRHDPTNDQALLWLVYLAEDGRTGLNYLARLLDVHPRHPQARTAIRWARRRVPTSDPRAVASATGVQRRPRTWRALNRTWLFGAVLLGLLVGLGMIWQMSQPSTVRSQQAGDRGVTQGDFVESASVTPSPAGRSVMEVLRVAIPLFTPTPLPSPTPAPTATSPPTSAWVPVTGQPQSRNLSCESRSVADLSSFWGVPVDELAFLDALGRSDNPHRGFVGDVDEPPGSLPPYGYGVYAEPVAVTMQDYGLDARAVYSLGLGGIRRELLAGRPVMVWGTYGMVPYEPREWTSGDGRTSTVVPFMHTFLVTGFDEDGLFLLDAYDSSVQYYPDAAFLQVWDIFDQMAVIVAGPLP